MPQETIAVIGLGYVGLPVALGFAQGGFDVVGYDIDPRRVAALRAGEDWTGEVDPETLRAARLRLSDDAAALRAATFFIVTVPTPIDGDRRPDLRPLLQACDSIGRAIRPGAVVVVESTVYPGVTEEICGPAIARVSGLRQGHDFKLGYSPERINPGDREHSLQRVIKVVAGEDASTLERVAAAYGAVVPAGLFRASSIRVAEAAKVIENTQRDLNIALMNELAIICHRLGIRTADVLRAARTKWNFLPFTPGLVGGHCIGVDPYYLTYKAQSIGFHPEIILAGRRINDGMAAWVAHDIVKTMVKRQLPVGDVRLLVMGFTFKENCPDTRNTKVADLVKELQPFAREVCVWDPHADPAQALHEYGVAVSNDQPAGKFDGVILAVRHNEIISLTEASLRSRLKNGRGFIYDIKDVLPVSESDARL